MSKYFKNSVQRMDSKTFTVLQYFFPPFCIIWIF